MSNPELALAALAACYAASLLLGVRLADGRTHRPVAAIGVCLIALGPAGLDRVGWTDPLLAVFAAGAAASAFRDRRPRLAEPVLETALLACSGLAMTGLAAIPSGEPMPLIIRAAAASLLIPGGGLVIRTLARLRLGEPGARRVLADEAQSAAIVDLVAVAMSGLTLMAFVELGPIGVLLPLFPLYASKVGFGRYVRAQETYDELVRALGFLVENAGYATEGHHDRVARLVGLAGREVGLFGAHLRRLELVALLHDVGAVSLPDPEDVVAADRSLILERGATVLEETEYLAEYAPLLRQAGRDPSASLEARLIRLACAFDRTPGGYDDRLDDLRRRSHPTDHPLIDALAKAVELGAVPATRSLADLRTVSRPEAEITQAAAVPDPVRTDPLDLTRRLRRGT